MSESETKSFTVKSTGICLLLTCLVFAFLTCALRPFVPDERPAVVWTVSAYTAGSLAGVFFFASNMFWAVLKDQLARKKQ